ncbi:hypothetical protein ACFY3O_36235 [Streptomyces sp. NPDC001046]|uniref:hypothetical protein n=1 Tax=Streptomyces sp. NPDC001046 TaxID=3364543 RepID=UPI003692D2ED
MTANEMTAKAVDEDTVIKNFLADRRRDRQRRALKITCYVMATGALAFIGLTVWQLMISSPIAGAYAGLAGVFVAATGVGSTVYFLIRRKDNKDARTGLPDQGLRHVVGRGTSLVGGGAAARCPWSDHSARSSDRGRLLL